MAAPRNSAADYAQALQALLPRGWVWPRDPTTVQARAISALAQSLARLDAAAQGLLVDAFPSTAVGLLTEWEATLGLPDPCYGPEPTLVQRQAAVVARLIAGGGQSVPYFTALALAMGFAITITEFTGSDTLANTWEVNVPATNTTYFRPGQTTVDTALETISTDAAALQCVFDELKPAHTILEWNFT